MKQIADLDFSKPASDLNNPTVGGDGGGGSLPNTNNNPVITAGQSAEANDSIKNFTQSVSFPPVTNNDRNKMIAAINSYKQQIKKTKAAAAKKAGPKAKPAKLLETAATEKVGTTVPDIAKFLPAGVDAKNVSFDLAIKAMETTVAQLETLLKNPANKSVPMQGSGNGFFSYRGSR